MSRSTRRSFSAITGLSSAKWDKQMAHRGVRRKQDLALKACPDYDSLLLPHFLECHWNNNYCWGRDGAQGYHGSMRFSADERSRNYYEKLIRK